ncbi:MAG: hypothetical protein O3A01_03995 [bacterium]|nr:hypothetical protein [bacterium]
MPSGLPHSVTLLQFIVDHLEDCQSVFLKNTPASEVVAVLMGDETPFAKESIYKDSTEVITFFQLILLSAISMFGGMAMSELGGISVRGKRITVNWVSGRTSTMTLGSHDRDYEQFARAVGSRVFSLQSRMYRLDAGLIQLCTHLMVKYMMDIKTSLLRLKEVFNHHRTLYRCFESEENLDLFFIVLSSLPSETLNSLYMHISKYIPPDLTVESNQGRTVRVQGFFQLPSPDVNFMIEKIKVHFNLFYFSEVNDVRESVHEQTLIHLKEALSKPKVLEQTLANVKDSGQTHLELRATFYKTMLDKLVPLLS